MSAKKQSVFDISKFNLQNKFITEYQITPYLCFLIIKLIMEKVKEIDVTDLIYSYLKKEDRGLRYLEKKTGLSYSHLYYIFVRKERPLTDDNRELINKVLGTEF